MRTLASNNSRFKFVPRNLWCYLYSLGMKGFRFGLIDLIEKGVFWVGGEFMRIIGKKT